MVHYCSKDSGKPDRIRLWKQGVRDLVMALCCALHNVQVRLTPWQPMM
jgi:hypothetical protein